MNVARVWGKANVGEEHRGQLLCINVAAHWPVTAMQLTDSLGCREATRMPCMQRAPLFIRETLLRSGLKQFAAQLDGRAGALGLNPVITSGSQVCSQMGFLT